MHILSVGYFGDRTRYEGGQIILSHDSTCLVSNVLLPRARVIKAVMERHNARFALDVWRRGGCVYIQLKQTIFIEYRPLDNSVFSLCDPYCVIRLNRYFSRVRRVIVQWHSSSIYGFSGI